VLASLTRTSRCRLVIKPIAAPVFKAPAPNIPGQLMVGRFFEVDVRIIVRSPEARDSAERSSRNVGNSGIVFIYKIPIGPGLQFRPRSQCPWKRPASNSGGLRLRPSPRLAHTPSRPEKENFALGSPRSGTSGTIGPNQGELGPGGRSAVGGNVRANCHPSS